MSEQTEAEYINTSEGLGPLCTGHEDYLTERQIEALLRAIAPHRVGKDGKGFSHVEAYELRAHLNRILGFARWSENVIEQVLIFEDGAETAKGARWTVAYRTRVTLAVCAPNGRLLATYTEGAVGDAQNQPSRADAHDLALKTSASQALKRCCSNLGDQFGLSLYRKGSLEPLVKLTLVGMPAAKDTTGDERRDEVQAAAPAAPRPEFVPREGHAYNVVAASEGQDPWTPAMAEQAGEAALARLQPPLAPPGSSPEPAKPPREPKSPDHYRAELLMAGDRKAVVALLRDLSMDGLADAEVGDADGVTTTLNALATARMKALT